MKMINKTTGEAVYFNPIRKNGKDAWIIQGGHRAGPAEAEVPDLYPIPPGGGLPEAARL